MHFFWFRKSPNYLIIIANDSLISDGTVLIHLKCSQTHKSGQGEYFDFPSQSDPIKTKEWFALSLWRHCSDFQSTPAHSKSQGSVSVCIKRHTHQALWASEGQHRRGLYTSSPGLSSDWLLITRPFAFLYRAMTWEWVGLPTRKRNKKYCPWASDGWKEDLLCSFPPAQTNLGDW